MFKSSLLTLAILFSLPAPPATHAETNYGTVAMHVAYMLQNHHLSHREFDETMSKKVLDAYLNFLDFNHIYFTQKDVDKFRRSSAPRSRTTSPSAMSARRSRFTTSTSSGSRNGSLTRKKELESKKFTFDSTRSLQVKRDKSPWPKDWRLRTSSGATSSKATCSTSASPTAPRSTPQRATRRKRN